MDCNLAHDLYPTIRGTHQLIQLFAGDVPLLGASFQGSPLDHRHLETLQLQGSCQEDAQRATAHHHVELRRPARQRGSDIVTSWIITLALRSLDHIASACQESKWMSQAQSEGHG